MSKSRKKKTKSYNYIAAYFKDVLDLRKGVDPEATIRDIKSKSTLSGANSWMLMCSIVIASIGLGQNSPAIIIGAMLISPLMSPILGIGLSIGINDMQTFRTCLIHFFIAILIAVFTSFIYFLFTPFDKITHEIAARTEPTFLDIFVAIFGGLAGIISIARKDISTTLPGVAIATALMPPLCVTGFGLAIGNFEMSLASFYLFFLNSFFVALATYVIVRILKFPYRHFIDRAKERKNVMLTLGFSLVLIIPSFFIFYEVLYEHQLESSIEQFKSLCLGDNAIYLDDYTLGEEDEKGVRPLYLKVYGHAISIKDAETYESCMQGISAVPFDIKIITTSNVNIDDLESLEEDLASIVAELEAEDASLQATQSLIVSRQRQFLDSTTFNQVIDEMRILYPALGEINFSFSQSSDGEITTHNLPTLAIQWNEKSNATAGTTISAFVQKRLGLDTLKIIAY